MRNALHRYMMMSFPMGSDCYRTKDIRLVWDALKPEGTLTWNPRVAAYRWGLDRDDREHVEVSRDMDTDEVVHSDFDYEYGWMDDPIEDSDSSFEDEVPDEESEDEGFEGDGNGVDDEE